MKVIFTIAIFLLTGIWCNGQTIELVSIGKLPKIKHPKELKNPNEISSTQQKIITELQSKGYLTASIDSVVSTNSKVSFYIYLGEKYLWTKLNVSKVNKDALKYAGYKQRWYNGKPINPTQFATLNKKLLRFYENNGYPFTQIKLDSLNIDGQSINAQLNVVTFSKVHIDSMVIKSTEKISAMLVENIIGIKKGEVYNEAKIRQISNRIKESGLFQETEPWKILFLQNSTKLYVFLKNNKSSQFNGIAGVQSNPTTGAITVTGDIDLKLQNVLKRAELINIKWKKFQTLSQELTAQANYPYILQSNFGTDLMLHLYKRDTSFLELEQKAEIQYLLSNGNLFKSFVKKYSSQTLSSHLDNSFTNIDVLYYGLGLSTSKVDYKLNPIKGYLLSLNGAIGNKRIPSEGTDEAPKILQGVFDNSLAFYIRLAKKTTLKIANNSKYILSDSIYSNELFRFGGLKTMRGFDEESLFASFYSINTFELRYLFEKNSAFYLFTDYAYFERVTVKNAQYNTALGTGLGISFETGAGIFTINYALGRLNQNPFLFRAAKVHFGFVAVF